MIGDGMGLPTVAHAHYYQFGADGFKPLAMESLPVAGLAYTHAADHLVTDSAASATALMSGCKTKNGRVGFDAQGKAAPTLLEEAKAAGLAAGVLTTAPLTHATPAAAYAHVTDRKDYPGIFGWLLRNRPEVAIGWGAGPQWPYIPADYAQQAGAAGYRVCRTAAELGRNRTLPVLMVFEGDHHALEGSAGEASGEPRLADLTTRTLDLLNQDPDGFFLMVEGGIIDWANHENNLKDAVGTTLDFDRGVGAVVKWVEAHGGWDRTLLVVTADHETGELAVRNPDGAKPAGAARAGDPAGVLRPGTYAGFAYGSRDHSASPVPVYAKGRGSAGLAGVFDNTRIHDVMRGVLLPGKKR
jgi:alkaline phosphatase